MKLLIALIVATVISYISCLDWRRSVKTVFFLVVFEGVLRKWILPQASEIIYFLKDMVLFGAYFQYYVLSKSPNKFPKTKTPIINILLFLAFSWCCFQGLNPSLGSPIVGIWGIKNYFFYIPLMWMLPNLFRTEEELVSFIKTQLAIFIPVGILGIVQFISPASSPLNQYAPGLEQVGGVARFGVSGAVRITGAFSFVNTYVAYLLVCCGFIVPILETEQYQKDRNISILQAILLIANSFMTGSRTIILAGLLFIIGYFGLKIFTEFAKTMRLIQLFLPPIIVAFVSASIVFADQINTILDRILFSKDVALRIQLLFTEPFHNIGLKGWDGFGSGATHQATGVLRSVLGLPGGEPIPVGYESEMGRILLEIGPIGFLLWYGLKLAILIALFQLIWKLKRPFLKNLALAAFLIHLIWFPNQHVFHITFSVYYGFLSGFLYLLPQIEASETLQQQQLLYLYYQDAYIPGSPYRES